ncbi:MAG: hypothetical protein NTV51_25690 [Verrucomicrobia bacterium]|nr:hypothetical protein [Verrucomicrobiota bacterium]
MPSLSSAHPLLVLAHPGHELRCHGWMEQTRPDVFVITDGSGSANSSRVHSSAAVIARTGARLLTGAGALPDRTLYAAVLSLDAGFFAGLRRQILALASDGPAGATGPGYTEVVCDGLEGFNPSHDLCHYLARSVAEELGLPCYDFPLEGQAQHWSQDRVLTLDDAALGRKLTAAENYPELAREVRAAIARFGRCAFALECFRRVQPVPGTPPPPVVPPYYETFGETRVSEGVFREVIRWEAHLQKIAAPFFAARR